MAILRLAYYESLKRYWRRKKYQRINGATHCKKKLKILRLGGGAAASPPPRRRRLCRIRSRTQKQLLDFKIVSPIKLLAKFHDAYVGMMICVAKKFANPRSSNNGVLGFLRGNNKKIAKKTRQGSLKVSSGEAVDSKLVLEIYEKAAAFRKLRSSTEL